MDLNLFAVALNVPKDRIYRALLVPDCDRYAVLLLDGTWSEVTGELMHQLSKQQWEKENGVTITDGPAC